MVNNLGAKKPVEFKGSVNGLYLIVENEYSFDECYTFLEETLNKMGDFYRGSSIIGTKGKHLNYEEKYRLEKLLTLDDAINVVSLEPLKEETENKKEARQESSQDESNQNDSPSQAPIVTEKIIEKEVVVSDTQVVYGTVRSGNRIEKQGHVIVVGDVNPGAEIIASGNVIVFGKLLGFVHAGASGDDEAIILSNHLAPTQIRISKYISVPPKDEQGLAGFVPEKAFVSEGIIKIHKVH